ncbi:MMPL family transporter [Bacillus pumilus]
MLAGIFIILIILLRSIVMPIYLTLSLILTYFTSVGLTEWIFKTFFGYDGLSWAVPFFSFVILVTLGIDYSIFLMDRFNEWKGEHVQASMISAMRNIGFCHYFSSRDISGDLRRYATVRCLVTC